MSLITAAMSDLEVLQWAALQEPGSDSHYDAIMEICSRGLKDPEVGTTACDLLPELKARLKNHLSIRLGSSIGTQQGFTIGPNNTRAQAFDALLVGHRIRQPNWPADVTWIVESNSEEILSVKGDTKEQWLATAMRVSNNRIAWSADYKWIVLPITDPENQTV